MPLNSKYPDLEIELGEGFTPIGEDEPVFPLRAQDGLAIAGIRGYLLKATEAGADHQHLMAVEAELHKWEAWQASNGPLIKMPDTDRDEDEIEDED